MSMPTLKRVGALLLSVCLCAAAADAQELTDTQLVDLIVRDGAQARAIRLHADVVRREQAARTVLSNPSIAYSREGAGYTEFLQVEQFLPIFGSRAAVARAGAAATSAAEAERDGRLWQLRADAQALVARLLAEQEKQEASAVTVREVARITALLRIREQEGEGSRFDRVRAEQELADARQMSLEAAASAAQVRAGIAAVVADGTRLTRVAGTLYVDRPIPAVEALSARALSTREDLRALTAASERFRLEADAALRAKLPAPTVVGGLKRADGGSGRESGGLLGVNVAVPLFDRGRAEAGRWLAERDRTEAERALRMQGIRAEVAAASEVLALRQEAIRAADAVSPAEELTRIAEISYTEGEAGILELLDAHRTAARARIRVIDMRLAARLTQIALERVVGETVWP
jgi:cobalt-zinc-cadmium efflux system outer membrane protein